MPALTTTQPADHADSLIAQAEADAALHARGDQATYAAELIRQLKYHVRQLAIDVDVERKLHQRYVDPFAWTCRDVDSPRAA